MRHKQDKVLFIDTNVKAFDDRYNKEQEAAEFKGLDVTNEWFSTLDVWVGQSLAYERIAWLKIHGFPIHLTRKDTFDAIGGHFGTLVHDSQLQSNDNDLCVDFVGVIVGGGNTIKEELTLEWSNKNFKVWIAEEIDNWIPDCIEEEDGVDEGID
ncbi:hypothetical protein Hanom_Chr01g00020881 [Helianthus anomalus]